MIQNFLYTKSITRPSVVPPTATFSNPDWSISCDNGWTYMYWVESRTNIPTGTGGLYKIETRSPQNAEFIMNLPAGLRSAEFDPINNEILLSPSSNAFFHVFNIENETLNTIGSNLGTINKYNLIYFYRGKIYGFPANALDMFIYDCQTKTFEFHPTISGNNKFTNCMGMGDLIYVGRNATSVNIGVFNTLNNNFSFLPTDITSSIIGAQPLHVGCLRDRLFLGRVNLKFVETRNGIYEYHLSDNTITNFQQSSRPQAANSFFIANSTLFFQRSGASNSSRSYGAFSELTNNWRVLTSGVASPKVVHNKWGEALLFSGTSNLYVRVRNTIPL